MNNDFDKKVEGEPIKIGVLDIETSDLKANRGYIICACVKEVNKKNLKGKTLTFRLDDYVEPAFEDDGDLIADLVSCIDEYDLILTWYGSRFDIPFVNTRALFHNIKVPQRNFRRDLCFNARGSFCLSNNKLVTWGNFLFGKSGKTTLEFKIWRSAMRGEKWAIDYIVTHCEKDVLETEKIYKKFMPTMGKLRRR